MTRPFQGLERGAWGLLVFFLFIILWGAWVRITGSGAGCGQHWPTCHGEIIPTAPALDTFIEFTHRVTSGMSVLVMIGLLIWGLRILPKPHPTRRALWWTFAFLIIECLIGAALVVIGLVGDNESLARAFVMAIHLVNTSLLVGANLLIMWTIRDSRPLQGAWMQDPRVRATLWGLVALLVVNVSGAVTALGDTLYPVVVDPESGLVERIQVAAFSSRNLLIQLRVLHPILAVAASLYLLGLAGWLLLRASHDKAVARWARISAALVVVQVICGFVNIALGAPGWMQILHLALAKLLWCAVVWMGLHLVAALRDQRLS